MKSIKKWQKVILAMSDRYYKNAAIMAVIKKYVSMNSLAAAICLSADKDYKTLTIQSVKNNKMKFKLERNRIIDMPTVIAKAIQTELRDTGIEYSVTSDIEDQYEFEFELKQINEDFVNQLFEITVNSKTVEVVLNE